VLGDKVEKAVVGRLELIVSQMIKNMKKVATKEICLPIDDTMFQPRN